MTDKYAVIGNPVAHSKSPFIHAEFARQTGQDISYGALLAPREGMRETVLAFRDAGGRGQVSLREVWRRDDVAVTGEVARVRRGQRSHAAEPVREDDERVRRAVAGQRHIARLRLSAARLGRVPDLGHQGALVGARVFAIRLDAAGRVDKLQRGDADAVRA